MADSAGNRSVAFDLQIRVDSNARQKSQHECVEYARQVREAMQREFDKLRITPNSGGANGNGHGGGNGYGGGIPGFPNGTPRFSIPGTNGTPGLPTYPPAPAAPPVPPNFTPPGPRIPVSPALPGGGGAIAGGTAAAGLGLAGAGSFATLGLAAAGASIYDTFYGNQYIARSGYGRMIGNAWTAGRERIADIGNDVLGWLSPSGHSEYFDPYGERKTARMERERDDRQARMQLHEDQKRAISRIEYGGFTSRLDIRARRNNDIFTAKDWTKGFTHDQDDFATSILARNAELNGNANDRRAVFNSQLENLAWRNRDMYSGRMTAALTNYGEYKTSNAYRVGMNSEDPNVKKAALEREAQLAREVKSIKQEQIRMELTGLEQIRQGREKEAQAIREAGMSAKERFGNLEAWDRQRINRNAERAKNGEVLSIEDAQEVRQFAPREIQNILRNQAFDRADAAGWGGGALGKGFEADEMAVRQEAAVVKAQIDGKRNFEVDIAINNPDAIGAAIVKSLDGTFAELLKNIKPMTDEAIARALKDFEGRQRILEAAKDAQRNFNN